MSFDFLCTGGRYVSRNPSESPGYARVRGAREKVFLFPRYAGLLEHISATTSQTIRRLEKTCCFYFIASDEEVHNYCVERIGKLSVVLMLVANYAGYQVIYIFNDILHV